jgi:hypothetical protein
MTERETIISSIKFLLSPLQYQERNRIASYIKQLGDYRKKMLFDNQSMEEAAYDAGQEAMADKFITDLMDIFL